MTPRGAALGAAGGTLIALLLSGCVYYNSIYNAEKAFQAGESDWSLGRDSAAAVRYHEVVRHAGAGYRKEPDGPWADEALYLVGRAHFRAGDLAAAEAALERARQRTDQSEILHGSGVYLGAIHMLRGEAAQGFRLLNEAMSNLPAGPTLGEGHFWRARIFMQGEPELRGSAWWDLEQAAALAPELRIPAALERVHWGLRFREPVRTREGLDRLLAHPDGGSRRDSVEVLVGRAAGIWDVGTAVSFLDGLPDSPWDGDDRARLRLAAARLLYEHGQAVAAHAQARELSRGAGMVAAEARLLLVRWMLADASDVAEVREVRALLLPSEEISEVAELLDTLTRFLELIDASAGNPLALFAAGEEARDVLGAPVLARGLFLAYANGVHGEPWIPKALLAALELSRDPAEGEWLRGRLEMGPRNPYVRATRGRPAPGLAMLEAELAERLQELRSP